MCLLFVAWLVVFLIGVALIEFSVVFGYVVWGVLLCFPGCVSLLYFDLLFV